MATVLNPRAVTVKMNNIPRNIGTGYGKWGSGKVIMPNGDFLFYGSVGLSAYIAFNNETIIASNMLFTEMPCDSQGNILLKSHWLQHQTNDTWPDPEGLVCFLHCTSEPTHRVNLQTGVITDNNSDNDYIRNMSFYFGAGVWE